MGLHLANPDFGIPGYVDILLGVDVFISVIRQGWQLGPPGAPWALKTCFGRVLSGMIHPERPQRQVISCFCSLLTSDELLQKFWQVESCDLQSPPYFLDAQTVVNYFHVNHRCDQAGRFMVLLPKNVDTVPLGVLRSLAIWRFLQLECSLQASRKSDQFTNIVEEYFQEGHAKPVPVMWNWFRSCGTGSVGRVE